MAKSLYITCPSYGVYGPNNRAKYRKKAAFWAGLLGWNVVESPLMSRYTAEDSWLPADLRAEDMRAAVQHDVVWAARGGYAAVEVAPALLEVPAAGTPLLIGYSDTTVLHACWRVRGWGPGLYGSLPDSAQDSRQAESLRAFFAGAGYRRTHADEAMAQVLRPGSAHGTMFAACLVVLANLVGTPAMPSLRGCILAIEDIDERPYAVDFALHQLHMAGALDGVVGLLGGSFPHTPTRAYGGPSVDQLLATWAERLQVPAVNRLPYGHLDDQMVMLSGTPATLQAADDGTWSLEWEPYALQ